MGKKCWVCLDGISENYGKWQWEFWGKIYRLSRCTECGSIFTDPLPDDNTLQQLYERKFDYRWYQDHYDAKVRDCRLRIKEYQQVMGRRVLDFGGGLGYFSAVARERGFESITYDPFFNKNEHLHRNWDTIVALHVLEHSNNPDSLIKQMKNLLTPRGKLILAVPNALSLGYKKLGMYWVWAQPPLFHVFHFTVTGLKILLERNNFIDLHISYHERWDANLYSDLERVQLFRIMDAAWAKKPCNSSSLYRKLVARINTYRRFKSLEKATRNYDPENSSYAELQVVASNPGKLS